LPIITHRTDTDLYKINMAQVVHGHFPNAVVKYAFKNRSVGVDLSPYAQEIRDQIDAYCALMFTDAEYDYLKSIRYLRPTFIDALAGLKHNPHCVVVGVRPELPPEDRLSIEISGGWLECIELEVPILAIVNEVYFWKTSQDRDEDRAEGRKRLMSKIEALKGANTAPVDLIEFGTRRRYSASWQEKVVGELQSGLGRHFLGTSNVYLAMKYGLKPFGTMAHEFLQACQALAPLPDFQRFAFDTWMNEFRGDLGIALSDVVGMDAFLHDFDKLFCKAYDGARHDSGDPYAWGEKLIAHYVKMGIDPRAKTAVFSDGLDVDKAMHLALHFKGRIKTSFGIGTSLTNDLGPKALQVVIKMTECNGRPVAKLSDSPGKTMCQDRKYLDYLGSVFSLRRPPSVATPTGLGAVVPTDGGLLTDGTVRADAARPGGL
jgi:nicotinate phosphoribosyltransferase